MNYQKAKQGKGGIDVLAVLMYKVIIMVLMDT
jgi:hypothetical protein